LEDFCRDNVTARAIPTTSECGRRRTVDDHMAYAWAVRNHALGVTTAIAAHILSGRMPDAQFEIATSFPPAIAHDERFWSVGPYRLQDFRAIGDGSYMESTTIVGGTGLLGLTLLGATAIGSAAGNRNRRDAAARDMIPRWVDIDSGHITIGSRGMYLLSASGLNPWAWEHVTSADMVAPGHLHFAGQTSYGPISWIVISDWAELAFVGWAAARHPRHRQLLDGSWFPGGWRSPAIDPPPTGMPRAIEP
jgi:hypothetical protein